MAGRQVRALGAVLAGVALVTAGCGGGSADPVANLGSTTSASSGTTAAAPSYVPYATCLTQHGFAASSPSGHGIQLTGNVDPGSPLFAAAQKACQKLLPAGGLGRLSAAQQAQRTKGLVKFSQCVRTHGVSSFPDPNPNSEFAYSGQLASKLESPLGRAAFKACDHLFPKIGPQISLGP